MEHTLRKPVESRRAYVQRRKTIVLAMMLALGLALAIAFLMIGCGSATSATTRALPATPPHVSSFEPSPPAAARSAQ
jgi:hypothetical protein